MAEVATIIVEASLVRTCVGVSVGARVVGACSIRMKRIRIHPLLGIANRFGVSNRNAEAETKLNTFIGF